MKHDLESRFWRTNKYNFQHCKNREIPEVNKKYEKNHLSSFRPKLIVKINVLLVIIYL